MAYSTRYRDMEIKPFGLNIVGRTLAAFFVCGVVGYMIFVSNPFVQPIVAPGGAAFGGGPADQSATVYLSRGKFYRDIFVEPFETVVFLLPDRSYITISTHEAGRVSVDAGVVVEELKKEGYGIASITEIVHNHFTPVGFTDNDIRTYWYFYDKGFRGKYGIYYTSTGKLVWYDGKKK